MCFLSYRQGIPIMGKNGKVIQDGTTTNFSLCQRNQPTTLRIRNIADSVHAAERLGSWTMIIVFKQFRYYFIHMYMYKIYCLINCSMRSNNPLLDGAQDVGTCPPPSTLDVEAASQLPVIASLAAAKTKLTKKPPKYSEIYKANDKTGSFGSVSSTNTSSLSSPPEYSSKVEMI